MVKTGTGVGGVRTHRRGAEGRRGQSLAGGARGHFQKQRDAKGGAVQDSRVREHAGDPRRALRDNGKEAAPVGPKCWESP